MKSKIHPKKDKEFRLGTKPCMSGAEYNRKQQKLSPVQPIGIQTDDRSLGEALFR